MFTQFDITHIVQAFNRAVLRGDNCSLCGRCEARVALGLVPVSGCTGMAMPVVESVTQYYEDGNLTMVRCYMNQRLRSERF